MSCKSFTLQGKSDILMCVVGSVHHVRALSRSETDLALNVQGDSGPTENKMPSGATYSTRPYGAHHSEKGAPQLRYVSKCTPRLVGRQDPEVKPLTRFQRKSLNIAVSVAAYLLTTTAIFHVANRLYDVGMDRIVEEDES